MGIFGIVNTLLYCRSNCSGSVYAGTVTEDSSHATEFGTTCFQWEDKTKNASLDEHFIAYFYRWASFYEEEKVSLDFVLVKLFSLNQDNGHRLTRIPGLLELLCFALELGGTGLGFSSVYIGSFWALKGILSVAAESAPLLFG